MPGALVSSDGITYAIAARAVVDQGSTPIIPAPPLTIATT